MQIAMIEASQDAVRGPNYGKFAVARFTPAEWARPAALGGWGRSLLARCGWGPGHVWVMDLETGEAAYFRHGGSARNDLNNHRIWVCVLFEPFLVWLYQQDLTDLAALPVLVELPGVPPAMYGYRRPGRRWPAPANLGTL